ncbi:hypothetical protein, partial [Cellulophaga sp. BC115SP]|uniref:hypothetical protein n=1 Tax=Cellulophaga sp. BC115SP TaxID=2683263 RepID=UPI00196A5BA3
FASLHTFKIRIFSQFSKVKLKVLNKMEVYGYSFIFELCNRHRRLAKKRVQCLNEAWCFVSNSVLADSLVLRNPLLRQAPKRWQ